MRCLVVLLCGLGLSIAIAGCSPTAKLSAEEATYIDALEGQTKTLDESWERAAVQMAPANSLQTWTAGLAAEGEVWRELYEDAQELTPPARFADLHAKNLEMLRLLTTAHHDLAYAVANNNPYYLSSGSQYFIQAGALAAEVKVLVKDAH